MSLASLPSSSTRGLSTLRCCPRAGRREVVMSARNQTGPPPHPDELDVDSFWQAPSISIRTPASTEAPGWGDAPDVPDTHDSVSFRREDLMKAVSQFFPANGIPAFEGSDDDDGVVYEWGEDDSGNATVTTYTDDSLPSGDDRASVSSSNGSSKAMKDHVNSIIDSSLDGSALAAINSRLVVKQEEQRVVKQRRAGEEAQPQRSEAEVTSSLAHEGAETELPELPELQEPSMLPTHRTRGVVAELGAEVASTSKFRDRWPLLLRQLRAWNYVDPAPKSRVMRFARANPDLLYHLPARELHLFVKKFAPFVPRTMERKVRAAVARLSNLYVAFEVVPTFNGAPTFQDVLRLLLFVSMSDFNALETKSPGIVSCASNLIPEILDAAVQPSLPSSRVDHAQQIQALAAQNADAQARQEAQKRPLRKPRRQPSAQDEEAESRLEGREARLAARLRGKQPTDIIRPWTPWDEADDKAERTPASRSRQAAAPRSKPAGSDDVLDGASSRNGRGGVAEGRSFGVGPLSRNVGTASSVPKLEYRSQPRRAQGSQGDRGSGDLGGGRGRGEANAARQGGRQASTDGGIDIITGL